MSSDPRSDAFSMKRLPARSCVTAGGISSPSKCSLVALVVDPFLPSTASTPIYAPDNKVPRPDTPLTSSRGRTTQKLVPSRARSATSLANSACTTTLLRSSLKPMDLTVPMFTSL
ncbi:hypothetical protein D3C71_1490080 [compost metagenome]